MPEAGHAVPELLSPAGGMEAAKAALSAGADAIYLGAASFGARAAAGFDENALRAVTRLFHLHGRRVYVTVNTLVKQGELPALADALRVICDVRADAVLVQDMGVLALIKRDFPALCVHASTQMALHNAAGVALLSRLGVSRVVLARECSLAQIKAAADTGAEIEAFVHGAQCVSVSGQCRHSGLLGGRSGNRGRCAQPCRMPYVWAGREAAWLSPRDLCLRDRLDELWNAGVAAFKIEGRLKRPEYVYTVTKAYRRALDALAEGRFERADESEKAALSQVFSRTFFAGCAFGARDADAINPARAGAAGVEIGRVVRAWQKGGACLCEAALTQSLNPGDGLQLRGGREQDMIYAGKPVPSGGVATLRLHFMAETGQRVIRIDDEALLSSARRASESGLEQVLPFDAELSCDVGLPARLTVRDGIASATAEGDMAQAAQTAALSASRARKSLGKTGGTPFYLRSLAVSGEGAHLSAAALNALRREALDKLAAARIAAHQPPAAAPVTYPLAVAAPAISAAPRLLFAQTCEAALAARLLAAGADRVLYTPPDTTAPALDNALNLLPPGTVLALPPVLDDAALSRLTALAGRRGLPLCAGSVGQIAACGAGCFAAEGVPMWNGEASALLLSMGVAWQTLPRELSKGEIAALPPSPARFILPVYGRARLMYLRHCPARTARGLGGERGDCRLCEQGAGCAGQHLRDRTGAEFPLLPIRMDGGCFVQLLSDRPRDLGRRALPGCCWLVDFTTESDAECLDITCSYRALLDGGDRPPGYLERYDKGVE